MKKISIYLSIILVMGTVSCKKILDINDNPNSATNSTPQLTMPIALEGCARIVNTQYLSLGFWVGYYAGSASFAKPAATYSYDIQNTFGAGTWDALYNNLEDIDYVEKQAVALKLPMYEAIAKVLKVVNYQQLVDLWGNVPYTDALKGTGFFAPKYDDAQTIYEDMVKKVDTAINIMKQTGTPASILVNIDGQKIIMFNDVLDPANATTSSQAFVDQWVRFANTVKLRLLMMQSQIPGKDAYIKQNLTGLTTADFLQSGENAEVNPGYQNTKGKFNPFFGMFYSDVNTATDGYNSQKASKNVVDVYRALDDTLRLGYVFSIPATFDRFLGSEFGDPSGTPGAANFHKGSGFIVDPVRPAPIMTSMESLFLQAEAVQRGYLTGSAQALYEEAVRTSFEYDGVASAYAPYMAQTLPEISWANATDKIQLIIGQKWLALNGLNVLAVFNDYRRTGFPNEGTTSIIRAPLSTDPTSKGKVPLRLFYPQSETLYNTANVTAQGNIDIFNTPIFWDK